MSGKSTKKLKIKAYKKPSKKIRKVSKLKIILSIVGVLILSMVSFFLFCLWQTSSQLPYVEGKVNQYLTDMSNEKYNNAYYLYSEEFRKVEDFATFEKKRKSFREGFKDYKPNSLELDSIYVNYSLGKFPTINYSGRMTYLDEDQASVTATFIYVNNNWEMVEVFVVASPTRWGNSFN